MVQKYYTVRFRLNPGATGMTYHTKELQNPGSGFVWKIKSIGVWGNWQNTHVCAIVNGVVSAEPTYTNLNDVIHVFCANNTSCGNGYYDISSENKMILSNTITLTCNCVSYAAQVNQPIIELILVAVPSTQSIRLKRKPTGQGQEDHLH